MSKIFLIIDEEEAMLKETLESLTIKAQEFLIASRIESTVKVAKITVDTRSKVDSLINRIEIC
jgi:hypothetical protein